MENIKNTTKYIKALGIILIAISFAISLPRVTLADDISYDVPGGISDVSYDVPGGISDVSYDVPGGISDVSYDVPGGISDVSYNVPGGISDTSYVLSGSTGSSGGSPYITRSNYSSAGRVVNYGSAGSWGGAPYITRVNSVQERVVNYGSAGSAGGIPYYGVYGYTQPQPQPVVTYYTQPAVVPNQVLAYTDTNPNVNSVYLSDVPYTGFEDTLPMIIFISSLVLWSAILAYVFLKRKIDSENVFAKVYASEVKINNSDDSVKTEFMNQVASDNSDLSKVEEYARMNKVLLSSDAVAKLVKLSRFGKIRVSDYIKSVATGEWIAIGENQIISK